MSSSDRYETNEALVDDALGAFDEPSPGEDRECLCVMHHTPAPQELHRHYIQPLTRGGPNAVENVVWLCPTSHANVHELLRAWERTGGEPPWEERQRFNPYVRGLAEMGWKAVDNT